MAISLADIGVNSTEDKSALDEAGDFALYGISSAVVSAGVSFANTAIELGNSLGLDNEEISTEGSLRSLGLDSTADYYSENATALDTVGFIMGSLVPGVAGVKALRAAQSTLRSSARLSTGLKRALLPQSAVSTIRSSLANEGVNAATTSLKQNTLKLIREGFHQEALEAAAFEGAVLLSMNQSGALERTNVDGEDLGYFDAVAANIPNAVFGLALGTGIGGAFASTKLVGAMKNEIRSENLRNKAMEMVRTEGERTGIVKGDAFLAPFASYVDATKAIDDPGYGSLTKGQQSELKRKKEVAQENIKEFIDSMTGGDTDMNNQLLDFFTTKVKDLDSGANYASGVKRFARIKDSDYVFDEQVAAVDFMTPEEVVPFMRGIYKEGGLRINKAGKRVEDLTDDEIYAMYVEGNEGFTFPAAMLHNKGVKGVSIIRDDRPFDPEDIFVHRHEVGHNRTDYFNSDIMKNSKLGTRMRSQAIALSRKARPGHWLQVDLYQHALATAKDTLNPEQIQAAVSHIDYMYKSQELLADSYSMLSNPNGYKEARKLAPDVFKLMYKNRALAAKLRGGRQAVRLVDGELMDVNVLPTAADLGELVVKEGTVSYGTTRPIALAQKFNDDIGLRIDAGEITHTDLNALYAASKTRKDIVPGMDVDYYDIPRLTAALAQGIPVKVTRFSEDAIAKYGDLETVLLNAKIDVGLKLLKAEQAKLAKQGFSNIADGLTAAQIGQVIDTGEHFVKKLTAHRIARNKGFDLMNSPYMSHEMDIPFWSARPDVDVTKPYYAKLVPDRNALADSELGKFRAAGIAETTNRIKTQRYAIDKVFNAFGKDLVANLEPSAYQSGVNFANNITPVDTTSGYFTSANADFLSGSQSAQAIGAVVSRVITKMKTELDTFMNPHVVRASADTESVYEFAALSSKIRQQESGNEFIFMPNRFDEFLPKLVAGSTDEQLAVINKNVQQLKNTGVLDSLFPKERVNANTGLKEHDNRIWTKGLREDFSYLLTKEFQTLDEQLTAINAFSSKVAQGQHSIKNAGLNTFLRNLVKYNGENIVPHKNALGSVIGGGSRLDPESIYLGPISPTKFRFHALVVSQGKGVMAHSDVGMLVAADAEQLQAKIARATAAFGDSVKIVTDKDIKQYKEYLGQYESDKLFRRSAMDSDLKRKGIYWDVTPEPDPNSFLDVINAYSGQQVKLTRSMFEAKYSEEIGMLRQYSAEFDRLNSVSGPGKPARNAYKDNINLMLNKRPDDPDSLWNNLNTITEQKISQAWYALRGTLTQVEATGDWQKMNEYMEQYGLDKVYSEANKLYLTNVNAPEPILSGLTSRMNAALGTMMLRMDATQAVVNAISMPITMVSEFNALKNMVSKERWQVMANGASVKIPGMDTTGVPHLAPMMFQATKNFFKRKDLMQVYKDRGYINSIMQDVQAAEESFAKLATETDPSKLKEGLDAVVKTLSIPTDYSEQFVKFVAANVADQLTTVLKIPERMKWSTVNTFVNRVHGNYIAAQRPTAFQGWLGQSIGLFQTYQFNLIQNLFRNVANGRSDIARRMIVVQGGIFGAQSVPGFQLVNQYVGEHSADNNDFYSGTSKLLGTDLSNALLYGLGSSAVVPVLGNGIDLYSRGDLTPRTPIILPTELAEIPMISMIGNFVGSVTNAYGKVSNGAPIPETMVNALAHNGLNRPLQGVFQLMEGARTTAQGTTLFTYDGWDTWNAVTKVMGTKTLDEAVAASSYYRNMAYKATRDQERNDLGEAVRQTMRAGEFDDDTYTEFMGSYAASGGDKEDFDRWVVRNMENATESQITRLRDNNNSPEGRYLQSVMGGDQEEVTLGGGL